MSNVGAVFAIIGIVALGIVMATIRAMFVHSCAQHCFGKRCGASNATNSNGNDPNGAPAASSDPRTPLISGPHPASVYSVRPSGSEVPTASAPSEQTVLYV